MRAGKMMREDTFSGCHPVVHLVFFTGALCFTMLIQAPVFLLGNILLAAVYHRMLERESMRSFAWIFLMAVLTACVNPVVNTNGKTVLFTYFGRAYTWESLRYGIVVGLTLAAALLWIGCYNRVVTRNKLVYLLGNVMPSVSLLLVMIFRMIPDFVKKAGKIIHARSCVGKWKKDIRSGTEVLEILASWSLENSVITADSMRSRAYGSRKPSHYRNYRFSTADGCLLAGMLICMGESVIRSRHMIGTVSALIYMMIPIGLRIKEEIWWHILKYRI